MLPGDSWRGHDPVGSYFHPIHSAARRGIAVMVPGSTSGLKGWTGPYAHRRSVSRHWAQPPGSWEIVVRDLADLENR